MVKGRNCSVLTKLDLEILNNLNKNGETDKTKISKCAYQHVKERLKYLKHLNLIQCKDKGQGKVKLKDEKSVKFLIDIFYK